MRSIWRADVELGPWRPRYEIPHRRVVAPADVDGVLAGHPFVRLIRRELAEAAVTRH